MQFSVLDVSILPIHSLGKHTLKPSSEEVIYSDLSQKYVTESCDMYHATFMSCVASSLKGKIIHVRYVTKNAHVTQKSLWLHAVAVDVETGRTEGAFS